MKILLAVDGSEHSQTAADEVARRPWPAGSFVRVVCVFQPYTPPATEFVLESKTFESLRQQLMVDAERLTTRVSQSLAAAGLTADTAVREGDPRSAIVDEAEEWQADLIVVGSHGRTGLTRMLLGSVATAVVNHAKCSIEVVRRRDAKAKQRG
jgi:nucleotide-binding universal stress UspA family protein